MLPDKDRACHRTGFEKSCRDLVSSEKCPRWLQIMGHNPNTGEPLNRWNCIDDWGPLLLIENSQMQHQTGAAVDKVATELLAFHNGMRTVNGLPELPPAVPTMLQPPKD
jgi:hypothetical protein